MVTPYTDELIDDTTKIRTFDPFNTNIDEYIWHRDKNDRVITVLDGNGWKLQFDNELPFDINKNDKIKIPKMVYHRIIPGKNKLRILINENL